MKSSELVQFPEMIFPNLRLRLEENPSNWGLSYDSETTALKSRNESVEDNE